MTSPDVLWIQWLENVQRALFTLQRAMIPGLSDLDSAAVLALLDESPST